MNLKEKYPVKSWHDYVPCDTQLIKIYNRFRRQGHIESILLYGERGVGKTSFITALLNDFKIAESYGNYRKIDSKTADDKKRAEDQVLKIDQALNTYWGHIIDDCHTKCVIHIDEIDQLKPNTFAFLKSHMEESEKHFVFVATTNHIDRIPDPIKSRFAFVKEVKHTTTAALRAKMEYLLQREGWPYTDAQLDRVVNNHYHDVRKLYHEVDFEFRP